MVAPFRRAPREDLGPIILKQAAGLFVAKGYDRATVREIAQAVGVTPAGLYYYFPSKQVLLFEVLKTALERVLAAYEDEIRNVRPDGIALPIAKLRAFAHRHITYQLGDLEETAAYGAAFYGSQHMLTELTDQQRAHLRSLQDRALDLLRGILREGIETGDFSVPDVTLSAFAIIGMGEYVLNWYQPDGRLSPTDIGAHHANIALRIAGASPPPGAQAEERGKD